MEINVKNRKAIERLLNQRLGYCLLTVSSEYGIQKIALKKKKNENKHTLFYFSGAINDAINEKLNSLKDSVRTTNVDVCLRDDGLLELGGFAKLNIDEAHFTLKNPSRRILIDNQTFRKIESEVSKRVSAESLKHTNELLEKKDEEIKKIKEENHRQKCYYTYDRLEEIIALGHSLIEINERKKLSTKEYKYGPEEREYVRTVYDDIEENYKFGVSFIAELLKDKFKYRLSDDGMNLCDEIITIYKKIDSIYYGLRSRNYDNYAEKLSTISNLYGFIAADLKVVMFEICDSIRENEVDTSLYTYEDSGVKDYWDDYCTKDTHEIYWKKIDNLFDSIIEGSATFIERVTGQDIREEINKRLGKKEVKEFIKK